MSEHMKLALAWFIYNDETYSGGSWEEKNKYWLTGKRTALATFFESHDEVSRLAKEYDTLIAEGKLPCLTEQEDETFYVDQQEEIKAETLQNIADDIISYSDGAYYIYEPEEFLALSAEDRTKVLNIVYEEIDSCSACGWYFHRDQLEELLDSGEALCWQCWDHRQEEEEDENSLV